MPFRRNLLKTVCVLLALAPGLAAAPARAEFHYYESAAPLTTPMLGGGSHSEGARLPLPPVETAAPFLETSEPSRPAPPAPMPAYTDSIDYAPSAKATATKDGLLSKETTIQAPLQPKTLFERGYDRAMNWSADLSGGQSQLDSAKTGLPRAMMLTRLDREKK